jgi:hypothetical protein
MKKMILLCFSLLMMGCFKSESNSASSDCKDKNCANYTSQTAAQAAFDADPACRNDLDRDKDGIACEEPGNSVKICTTTSNCGCSNKTKAECEADPCCKWVVGDGCNCR